MKIQYVTGSVLEQSGDLLAFTVYDNPAKDPLFQEADEALDGLLATLAKDERFEGKSGQSLSVTCAGYLDATHLAVLGAGSKDELEPVDVRDIAARTVKLARRLGAGRVVFCPPELSGKDVETAAQHAAEGALLGDYKFLKYKPKEKKKRKPLTSFGVVASAKGKKKPTSAKLRAALKRGRAIAESVCLARDLINEPAAFLTPTQMASEARKLGRKHSKLSVKVFSRKECETMGMGLFLAVGRGSSQEPKLVHMTYKPSKASKRIALIGKGVTFDSGGYSLKPSASMEDMKVDMSGAAAVVAAMGAIASLGCPYEVHAVTALCENMVAGNAYKLGDVFRGMDGTTVEINNTDAEGRLTLADAITYTRQRIEPDLMLDFATLTGACMVALGPHTAGVMSPDDDLAGDWLDAATRAGESMWRLPLTPRLRDQLKSNIADMRNTGERWGGAITAGLFLKHFVRETPWVHVDIAGPASVSRDHGATIRGGTGFGVATIVEYLTS